MKDQNETAVLTELARSTIEQLANMPQPIVRVCGPLTTGGLGYEENARRLARAEAVLTEKGYTVFRFGDAEASIQGKAFSHEVIMTVFHEPILVSGLIAEAFFLPHWNESKGATIERDLCATYSITIAEFPEEWFS